MLESIRKRKNNFFLMLIVFAVVAVMALFGVNMNPQRGGEDAPIAFVNGEVISVGQFQGEYQRSLLRLEAIYGKQFDPKWIDTPIFREQILDQLVQRQLLGQQTEKLDFLVSDAELADFIRSLPYYQRKGVFDAERYKRLPNRGLEERQQRKDLEIGRLRQYVLDRAKITPDELKRGYELKETKVNLTFAKIDFDHLTKGYTLSAKQISTFLKNTPENELKVYYDSHKQSFTLPGKVKLHQIRVGVPFRASDDQKAQAKKKLEEITKALTPETFAEVAKKHSDDEYAKKGGARGWVDRGTLSPQLEQAIDSLEPGRMSEPVELPFGYFILKVEEKKPESVHPIEEVKRDIVIALAKQKHREGFEKQKLELWEKRLADGKDIATDLRSLKIKLDSTGSFGLGQGSIPKIGSSDVILDGVVALRKKNDVAKKLFYFQNNYYYVKLKSIERPKTKSSQKAQETLDASLTTSLQSEIFGEWVTALKKNATIKKEVKF